MNVTGPIQPMAGGGAVQENFEGMVNHVLWYRPDCPPGLAKKRLNTRLRQIQDQRLWAGLLVRGILSVPGAYSTGSITATRGSDLIVGSGTSWPYDDLVSTTLAADITIVNELQDVTPTSMSGISPGDWLVFDSAGTREFILVISVGASTFRAKPTLTHSAGISITKSRFVRRQFRLGTTKPFYTIRGVTHDEKLKLDLAWADSNQVGVAYTIVLSYVSFEQNYRAILTLVNTAQGWRLRTNMPQEVLNVYDTWRQTTGWVYMLVDYIPDEIGRMQFELYPTPSMEQGFPYLGYRTIPNLEDDEDTPPPCMPSHLLVHGALADVMIYDRKSAYYDPAQAAAFEVKFQQDLQAAIIADDNVYMQNLQWAYSRYPFTQHGASYWQSHDVSMVYGEI